MPGSLRDSIERASVPALGRVAALPRLVPFVVVLALVLAGLFVSGVGPWLLALVLLLLLWLLYLGWPRLTGVERLMRLAVIVLVLAVIVVRLAPR